MSRLRNTYDTIDGLKSALIGDVKKPELMLIPLLSEIALSLAAIADSLREGED